MDASLFAWADQLKNGDVVFLFGEMGVGKTTLVGEILNRLAQARGVSNFSFAGSPTYAIHQTYQWPELQVDHWDLYRLATPEEIEGCGFYEWIQDSGSLHFVEWPERLGLSSNSTQVSWLPRTHRVFLLHMTQSEGTLQRHYDLQQLS